MKLTNKFQLPLALVNAVKNDPYNPGVCDLSVTRLIAPPVSSFSNIVTAMKSKKTCLIVYGPFGVSRFITFSRKEPRKALSRRSGSASKDKAGLYLANLID